MLLKLKILDLTTWVLADNKTKKILITGGAGFIGSHLCKTLINENHYIICLDNLLTGSINNISELMNHPNFEFVKHDIIEPYYRDGINEIYNLVYPKDTSERKTDIKDFEKLSKNFEKIREKIYKNFLHGVILVDNLCSK